MRRSSGILCHITSLPSRYGTGDLGPAAYEFADFLERAGQTCWQVLPINPTDTAHGSSPYSSSSVFAFNTLLISPELLARDGFVDHNDIVEPPDFPTGRCNFQWVYEYKSYLFDRAFDNFNSGHDRALYDAFCKENSFWLDDYALYRALKTQFDLQPWDQWPDEFRFRHEDALESARGEQHYLIEKEKFCQFLFHNQWKSLKKYCNEKNIQIIGDLPIYVNYDSADTWSNHRIFKLDDSRKPVYVSGVPPDYFSETGQLWGNPVYNWDEMRSDGFRWWVARMGRTLECFDSVRIDHFMGLFEFWEVPAGDETAVNGHWADAPFDDLMDALLKRYGAMPVIAEDLGFVPPRVREAMARYDITGMKVLLFAFHEDHPHHPYLPHSYPRNCVVYTGTHDNNTVRGWLEQETGDDVRRRIRDYFGRDIPDDRMHLEFIRLAMMSVADIALLPVQDILGLGAGARLNTPSVAGGNWEWRLEPGALHDDLARHLRHLATIYGRV